MAADNERDDGDPIERAMRAKERVGGSAGRDINALSGVRVDDDPIERAMRARANADESAGEIIDSIAEETARGSILGSALDRLDEQPSSSENVLFAAPKRSGEVASGQGVQYVPQEKSFFSTSAQERAEQARRAATRVRRRSFDEDSPKVSQQKFKAIPEENIGRSSGGKSTQTRDSLSRLEILRRRGSQNTAEAKAPSTGYAKTTNHTAAAQDSQPSSIMDRAIRQKPGAEQSTEPKVDPVLVALKASQTKKPAAKQSAEGIVGHTKRRMTNLKDSPQSVSLEPKSDRLLDRIRAARVSQDAAKKPVEPPKVSGSAKVSPVTKTPPNRLNTAATGRIGTFAAPPVDPSQSVEKQIEARKTAPKNSGNKVGLPSRQSKIAAKAKPTRVMPNPPVSSTPATEIPPIFGSAKPGRSLNHGNASPMLKAPAPEAHPLRAGTATAPTVEPTAETPLYSEDASVVPTSGIKTAKTKAFAPFEWMVASRYLRARKKEGFVSVITGFSLVGIALGVATLIVVMAVMTGFRETLISQIIGGSPHINIVSQVGPFENFDDVADQVRTVEGVENVVPVVQGQVLGTGNGRHTGVLVRGMRKGDLERLIERAEPEVVNGSLERFVEDDGVALGADLAAKLGLRVGDFITMISPDGDISPFSATPLPRVKDYRIIQTFKLGVQEIDYNVAFMTFGEAQLYFNKQKQADTLDVFVADAENVEKYSEPIHAASRSSIGLYSWKRQNGRLIGAINLERQVMFVILTMIILVASLNIISGLVMLVKDKARDIAIMRTMGMARGSILRIFFICGSSIGVIGSLLGVILGVMFVLNIHAIQGFVEWVTGTSVWDPDVRAGIAEIPAKLQFSDVALTLFIALGLSFIATLFPAWKAAKLDPVEALRYE